MGCTITTKRNNIMKILLLGGNGYIGSKLYKDWDLSHNITSIDLCLFGKNLQYSQQSNFNYVDISNYDVIICLAGHSSVPMCEYSSDRSWINNVDYFRKLCNRLSHDQKLIYASSASVYGNGTNFSTEDSPINFSTINHYDLQKITLDLVANKYINEGKKIIGLRFGTVNGSSPNTRSDLMINSMIKSALETGNIMAKNLQMRRSILGINDATSIIKKIVDVEIKSGQYNLGSFNSNVEKISQFVSTYTGAKLNILPNDAVTYDFEMGTEKITSVLDYVFQDTIETIIKDLIKNHSTTCYDDRKNDRNIQNFI